MNNNLALNQEIDYDVSTGVRCYNIMDRDLLAIADWAFKLAEEFPNISKQDLNRRLREHWLVPPDREL